MSANGEPTVGDWPEEDPRPVVRTEKPGRLGRIVRALTARFNDSQAASRVLFPEAAPKGSAAASGSGGEPEPGRDTTSGR